MHSKLTTIALLGLITAPLACGTGDLEVTAAYDFSHVRNDAFDFGLALVANDQEACAALDDFTATFDGEPVALEVSATSTLTGEPLCPDISGSVTLPEAPARDGELVFSGAVEATIVIADLIQHREAIIQANVVTDGEPIDIDFVPAVLTPPRVLLREERETGAVVDTVLEAELSDGGARATVVVPADTPPDVQQLLVSGAPPVLAASTCTGVSSCVATTVDIAAERTITIVGE